MKERIIRLVSRGAALAIAALALVALTPTTVDAQERQVDEDEKMMEMSWDPTTTELIATLRSEDLTVFADLVEASGLAASFSSDEPLTFFVPKNSAFADVPQDAVEGAEYARDVVSYLTVKGAVQPPTRSGEVTQIESIGPLVAVRGISLERTDEQVMVVDPDESARVVGPTFQVGPHVVHVIDGVLLPSAESMD